MKAKLLIALSLLAFNLQLYSQKSQDRQTILQFDDAYSVLRPDAPTLNVIVPMDTGIANPLFLSEVGGVSFDQIAQPANELTINSLKLNYNKNASDGNRLELFVNNKPAKVDLPDWLLVPLAKYAESPYYSCVTIFGKLNNKTLEKLVVEHKGRVINYHPAFDNTLLGIRLIYMDMLVGYTFTQELPKNKEGKYILGLKEAEPNQANNQNGAYYLIQHFNNVGSKYNQTFRSYVISDYSQDIRFNIENDKLTINSFPYFYCWRYNSDRNDYDINKVSETISSEINLQIAQLSATPGGQTPQEWMIDKLIALAKKYDGKYGFYSSGTFVDMVKLPADSEKRQFLQNYSLESLFQMIVTTEAYMDSDSIVYLKEYSDEVSSKPDLFEAANPEVWNATVQTMCFASFFRFIKTNYPAEWSAFMDKIGTVDPEPRIFTPTAMYEKGDSEVENALRTASPQLTANGNFHFYPNPFCNFLVLNNSTEMDRVCVYGTDGKLLLQEINCPSNYRMNTSSLKPGVYILVVNERNRPPRTFNIVKK